MYKYLGYFLTTLYQSDSGKYFRNYITKILSAIMIKDRRYLLVVLSVGTDETRFRLFDETKKKTCINLYIDPSFFFNRRLYLNIPNSKRGSYCPRS